MRTCTRCNAVVHPPGLRPESVKAEIVVWILDDGSLGVEHPGESLEWVLACLANAQDAVRSQMRMRRGAKILAVPNKDVVLPGG